MTQGNKGSTLPPYSEAYPVFFFVDPVNSMFPGFSKLLREIPKVFPRSEVISTLEGRTPEEYIIPVGIVASDIYLRSPFRRRITFLIDSTALGLWSGLKFYIRRRDCFNRQALRILLRLVKYLPLERRVARAFEKVIVVSPYDAAFLASAFSVRNTDVIMNGADLPASEPARTAGFSYTLGILSYWGASAFHDVNWFIEDYLPKLRKIFPELRLVTAGRGASDELVDYFAKHGVVHMGEVSDLALFFSSIDIYVTTLRQECGILNKVLDAFAHRKIVIGLRGNMHPFLKLENGYFTYTNLKELEESIRTIARDPEKVEQMTLNAYRYILEEHDWGKNYSRLKAIVDSLA
jgi:glycosyltransferase involved in cell wall biosynthesis